MPIHNVVGFEWDETNLNHLGERGVASGEIEQVLSERHVLTPNRRHPGRMLLIGRAHGGRVLIVSIEPTRHDGIWRPITAREAEPEEKAKLERRFSR